ncbi:MAG: TIGR00730 family Rossman fold protein [Alkalispirochaetaceae bacterium]
MNRLCVYCGSSPGNDARFAEAARAMARAMVSRGMDLVYGGGKAGLMGIVADEILKLGGSALGIIPRHLMSREIAHGGLTELIEVETMHERKAMMIERADGFVALPGGVGTLEEISEVLSWAQMGLHRKPIGLLNTAEFYDPFVAFFDHLVDSGFVSPKSRQLLLVRSDPSSLLAAMSQTSPSS